MGFALDHQHYLDESGDSRQPNRIKPKTRALFALIRHQHGQMSAAKPFVDIIPNEEDTPDPILSAWKEKLEHKLADPQTMYFTVRDIVIIGMLTARMWAYRWDYSTLTNQIEIVPVDGRRIRWTEGYHSPHQRTCPAFWEVIPDMDCDQIEQMTGWKNNKNLLGDNGTDSSASGTYASGQVDLVASSAPSLEKNENRKTCTVVMLWRRVYGTAATEKQGSFQELPPEDQYQACMTQDGSGCGYQSPTMGQQSQDMGSTIGNMAMPDMVPGGCPECGGDLHAITHTVTESQSAARLHLTIFAPNEGGAGRVFYADFDKYNLPTIPYCIATCYVNPIKPMGQSETSVNKSDVMSLNLLDRIGLENIMQDKPYKVIPANLKDYQGEPWQGAPEQGLWAYADPLMPPGSVQSLQGNGMSTGWPTIRDRFDASLRQDMGTNDFNFGPNQTKDIAVGTVQTLERVGEIPVQHKIDRLRQAESLAMGALVQLMRATEIDATPYMSRTPQGSRTVNSVAAAELPPIQAIVTADPATSQLLNEDTDNLIKIMGLPRPQRRLVAKRNNIPLADIEQLEQMEDAEVMRQAQMGMALQAQMGPPGAGPPAGAAPGGRGQAQESPPNSVAAR